jgi:uncharacterized membrane protein (DUF4010 family)
MTNQELYLRFFVALAIGLVIGIERGWRQRDEPSGEREAGVRTFTIFALTGFAAGIGVERLGTLFAAVAALAVIGLIGIGYASDVSREKADRGVTTEAAGFLVFVLGALSGAGAYLAAGLVAVVTVALLDQKEALHGFLQRVQKLELTAAVKLLLVSVVLLPVLPNEGFGPGQVLNPYELWWAVVVIAALGFAGYAAMKVGGIRHGALFMGLVGGLVSSTGVTVSAARASKEAADAALPLASAIATAQAVMFIRTGVLVGVLNPKLIDHVAAPLALGALTALVGALILVRRAREEGDAEALNAGTPDTLSAAIKFVVIVAGVLLLAHYAQSLAGDIGLVVSGLLSGAVDVDAATVAASRLTGAALRDASALAGAASIVAAIVANSAVKSGIAFVTGARSMARPACVVLAASAAAAIAGVAVTLLFGK